VGKILLFLLAMVCSLPSMLLLIPFGILSDKLRAESFEGWRGNLLAFLALLCCVALLLAGWELSEYIARHSGLWAYETFMPVRSRTGSLNMLPRYLTYGGCAGVVLSLLLMMPLGGLLSRKTDRDDLALRDRLLRAEYRFRGDEPLPRRIRPLGEYQWRELTPEEVAGLQRFHITLGRPEFIEPKPGAKRRRPSAGQNSE
jgi:hypothetical protein